MRKLNPIARHTSYRCWLWTSVACLVLLAGCATPPKNGSDASKGAPAAAKAAPAKAPAPVAAPNDSKAAPAKPQAAQGTLTDKEKEAIRNTIYEKIKQQEAQGGAKTQTPAAPQESRTDQRPEAVTRDDLVSRPATADRAKLTPAATTLQPAGPLPPGQKPAPGEKTDVGCSKGTPGSLTPPPPDEPQPKFVCKEPKITVTDVWKGQPAKFAFNITNEGAGPLQIKLKGG